MKRCRSRWPFKASISISAGATRTLKVSGSMETAGWSSISIDKEVSLRIIISLKLAPKSDQAKVVHKEILMSSTRILLAEDNVISQKVG